MCLRPQSLAVAMTSRLTDHGIHIRVYKDLGDKVREGFPYYELRTNFVSRAHIHLYRDIGSRIHSWYVQRQVGVHCLFSKAFPQ
jgi:hypothetical protein